MTHSRNPVATILKPALSRALDTAASGGPRRILRSGGTGDRDHAGAGGEGAHRPGQRQEGRGELGGGGDLGDLLVAQVALGIRARGLREQLRVQPVEYSDVAVPGDALAAFLRALAQARLTHASDRHAATLGRFFRAIALRDSLLE